MGIVIGGEVFLCMAESVFEAGQSPGVRNVVRTLEREMVLAKGQVTFRQIVLISVFLYVVFRRPLRNITKPPIVAI